MPKETVLVVDDTEEDRDFVSGVLRQDGFTVEVATSGTKALDLLGGRSFDLILTDLVMPGATGFDVMRQAHQGNAETICIAMTSFGSLEGAIDALKLGAYSYLLKPCDANALRHTIHRGLEKQRLTKELRERNAALDKLNRELDQRVQDAVAELRALNHRMLTEMASLREVDELKSAFLDNVTHDLRSPVTTIRGYMGFVLESEGLTAEQKDHLLKARTAINHMEYLVGQLLGAARLTSGLVKLNREELNIREIVDEAVALIMPQAKAEGLSLSASCEVAPSITLNADRGQLLQVLNNLLGNACKFTPAGGSVKLVVTVDNAMVTFCVEDTGPGIAAEHLPRIFEKFYQVRGKSLTAFKGLGLGLRIAKDIVALHGGNIWVESKVGKGSQFYVELPLRSGAVARSQA